MNPVEGPGPRVAFLKGINVGGHRLTMRELRAALTPLGLTGVQTFIASGNVAFEADARTSHDIEVEIEAALGEALGYDVRTFVRTPRELTEVAEFATAENPGEGWKPHVMFGRAPTTPAARAALADLENPDDRFRFWEREVVWLRRGGLTESVIKAHHLDRALQKQPVTSRTLKTVVRIADKLLPSGS